MEDTRELISLANAAARLPAKDMVHTFRQASFPSADGGVVEVLLGADMPRELLLDHMRTAGAIEVTGPAAQAIDHGLAIRDTRGALFIETRPECRQ